jgi:hypothetical protein
MSAENISFEQFREQWLQDVTEGTPSTTELGRRFAFKLVKQWLEADEGSTDLIFCDGSGDGGIDLGYLDRGDDEGEPENASPGHTWFLFQSKYGTAFQGINTLLEEGHKVIDTLDGRRPKLSSLAEGLLELLQNFRRNASDKDRIVLVFATDRSLNEDETRVLRDLRAMGRERLGALFDVQSVSIETIYERMQEELAARAKPLAISMRAATVPASENLLIGSVGLLDLYGFLKAYRDATEDLDRLYEKNVRRFLGLRGKVNKPMLETIKEAPQHFGLYNNGITFVVTDYKTQPDGSLELIEPYVVNGCQTTRTIWEACRQRLEAGGTGQNPELEKWVEQLKAGFVVCKIVKVGSDGASLLSAITRYTNTQNRVSEKDFIALTSDFQTWANLMADHYNVYLEIQRGGWDSQKALQKQSTSVRQFKESANAFDLLKVYGSGWLAEAGLAFGKNPPFLPNGSVFKRIVNEEGVQEGKPFGVEDLYAAYLVQKGTEQYKFGRGAQKSSRRQTKFLFYLIVIELLKDAATRAGLSTAHKDLSLALIKLFAPGKESAAAALFDSAVEVVDSYLTQGSDNSVFDEPAYKQSFNLDLNGFLKWEKLGKSEDSCPRFRNLLAVEKTAMAHKVAGQNVPPVPKSPAPRP